VTQYEPRTIDQNPVISCLKMKMTLLYISSFKRSDYFALDTVLISFQSPLNVLFQSRTTPSSPDDARTVPVTFQSIRQIPCGWSAPARTSAGPVGTIPSGVLSNRWICNEFDTTHEHGCVKGSSVFLRFDRE
jgi:hypothetical protein